MVPFKTRQRPSKPRAVGSSPTGRTGFPRQNEAAESRIRSDSVASSPRRVPAEDVSRKTNTRAALNAREAGESRHRCETRMLRWLLFPADVRALMDAGDAL